MALQKFVVSSYQLKSRQITEHELQSCPTPTNHCFPLCSSLTPICLSVLASLLLLLCSHTVSHPSFLSPHASLFQLTTYSLSAQASPISPLCFKTHSSRLSLTPRPRPHAAASRLGLDLTPRPRPHAAASRLGLDLTPRPRPHALASRLRLDLTPWPRPHSSASRLSLDLTPHSSASTSRLTPRPRPHAFLFKLHGSRLSVQASRLKPQPHASASRLGLTPHASATRLTPHASHLTFSSTPLNSQLSTLKTQASQIHRQGSVMSKNLVDAPLPSVEESITGPLLLDHEMDSTQGDPIQIDDDEEDTDEGIPDKKRKKKSQVWLEFKEIEVGDGTKKAECMHCKQRLKYAGTTSQLKRHLDNTCTRRKIALRSQRMLNVVPVAPGISKAIPITTVASESTFSAGGRVIDTYRASLSTDTVQALVCGGDWVRHKFGIKKKPRKRDNTLFEEEVVITIP
ncbi:zinc finger BED domain-containing protein RICESLEEPER 2-like [Quillaja saponaria]|uniref:Zinc finger BED domain-containing protein RICESLEEPER 2-like n=1 Tax=Quillaja saponaria TaxID=32244 RepID=A0AAD7PCU8_QUISA|nr:zinc finger BED domain-containing protein RICESLEEPER 2-like [Quillaja saponaria]